MTYLLLVAGLVLLIVGGDLLVRASVAWAVRLSIAPMVIGLTVVAFGTSAPEFVVSVDAAMLGSPELALGNVVGSNIANVLLVLGLPSMIAATDCDQPFGKRNSTFLLAVTLVFAVLCLNGPLSTKHGLLLLALLAAFFVMSVHSAMDENGNTANNEIKEMIEGASFLVKRPGLMAVALLAGLILLPVGAHMTVEAARTIATLYGVSEKVIGLSIVAFGTSLPEIVTTMIAAYRGQSGLAIGNAIGSCVFNLLAIMGITSLVAPLAVPANFFVVDMWVLIFTATLPMIFIAGRRDMGFVTGALFVAGYVGYMAFLFYADPKPDAQALLYRPSPAIASL